MSAHLGVDGEQQWSRLERALRLQRRLGRALVVTDNDNTLTEIQRRVASLGHELRTLRPSETTPQKIRQLAAERRPGGAALPVAWVEADGQVELARAWGHGLAALNRGRETLADQGPVFVILAGPRALLDLVGSRAPDLWSVMEPVITFDASTPVTAKMPETFSWLHLSDLHIKDDWRQDLVLRAFVDGLPRLLEESALRPDAVFVTGDVACSGQPAQYETASELLREVMRIIDKSAFDHLFLVPGNHDVDRAAITRQFRRDREHWRTLGPDEFREDVGETIGDPRMMEGFGARLSAWRSFTLAMVGSSRETPPGSPWRFERMKMGALEVGIASLCSAWACGPEDDQHPDEIVLGERQVRLAAESLAGTHLNFALMHHPPGCLAQQERRNVSETLERHFQLILHGHLHEEDLIAASTSRHTAVRSGVGALYAGTKWHHGFQIGRYNLTSGMLEQRFFTYSERSGGHWHPKDGVLDGTSGGWVRRRVEGWVQVEGGTREVIPPDDEITTTRPTPSLTCRVELAFADQPVDAATLLALAQVCLEAIARACGQTGNIIGGLTQAAAQFTEEVTPLALELSRWNISSELEIPQRLQSMRLASFRYGHTERAGAQTLDLLVRQHEMAARELFALLHRVMEGHREDLRADTLSARKWTENVQEQRKWASNTRGQMQVFARTMEHASAASASFLRTLGLSETNAALVTSLTRLSDLISWYESELTDLEVRLTLLGVPPTPAPPSPPP